MRGLEKNGVERSTIQLAVKKHSQALAPGAVNKPAET